MSLDLSQCKVVVFVFAQPECPACAEFEPVLHHVVAARARDGFVMHTGAGAIASGTIPVFVYDVRSVDVGIQNLIEQFQIYATPTLLVLTRDGVSKVEGTITPGQLDYLFNLACEYNR